MSTQLGFGLLPADTGAIAAHMLLADAPGTDPVGTPYCGPVVAPAEIWGAWNGDPWLLAALTSLALAGMWWRAVSGRDDFRDRMMAVAFAGLIVAFVSPLCAATVALFSARTVHHLILLSVVAPALALALPWRPVSGSVALALTSAALILWHLPAVYDAAWQSAAVYWGMQGAMLFPAWLFWSVVLGPSARAEELLARALLVGGLAGVMGFLGAILTFAPLALYPQHLVGADAYGLTLLADQQLAGLIMWVPGFVPLAALAFWMLRRGWLRGYAR